MTTFQRQHIAIPISTSLEDTLEAEGTEIKGSGNKQRIIFISALSIVIAVAVSFAAKLLIGLIDLITNISFFGRFSIAHASPAGNHLGIWVIAIPVIGGVLVGLMALYGSPAIRGHGIPEAMEQILTNKSRIKPSITFLKPISAALSIGTGGPFGAEGPIIATGGALGSTIGQLLKISHNERKILLTAGSTAGMSAIFGTPVAAIFLAVELLLFEFSPRSIIPVALACITGAAGHHFLFESGPAFAMQQIAMPSNTALACYSIMGILMGLIAAFLTRILYLVEDGFERLPIHWMWWPAIGGIAVGVVGYFAPHTLGVGYDNISGLLSGNMAMNVIISLCLLKFISWAIALGSGTSGGTLAPLLTIGGAAGALLGTWALYLFPGCGINIPLAALTGMAAMFAGASRALLTSIIFCMEATGQEHALLPLLGCCTAAYFVSYFLMENTIMTEKIARRGIKTPHSYEPDILEQLTAGQVQKSEAVMLNAENTIGEVRSWLHNETGYQSNFYIIANDEDHFAGIISSSNLLSHHHDQSRGVGELIKRKPVAINDTYSLRAAAEIMANENLDVLALVSEENKVTGILSYRDIINAYKHRFESHQTKGASISLKRQSIKILVKGQKLMELMKGRK